MISLTIILISYILIFYLINHNKFDRVIELILLIFWLDYEASIITMFSETLFNYQYYIIEGVRYLLLIYLLLKLPPHKVKRNIYLLILSSYILLNSVINYYGLNTIRYLLNNLIYLFIIYKIFQNIEKDNIIEIIFKFSEKAAIISLFFVVVSVFSGLSASFDSSGIRVTAFIGPAKFASRLFFLLVIMIVIYHKFNYLKKLGYSKIFFSILLAITIGMILLTQTRISIIAFIFVLSFYIIINSKLKMFISTTILFIFVILLLASININTRADYIKQINIIKNINFRGITSFYSLTESMRGTEFDKVSSGRFYLWNIVLKQFDKGGFWGNGGNFSKNYFVTTSSKTMNFVDDMIYNSNYHNDPLRFYLEHGYIGLFLFLGFYLFIIIKTSNWKIEPEIRISIIKNIIFLFLLGGLFIMNFDNFYETHKYVFFAFLGILSSLESKPRNDKV